MGLMAVHLRRKIPHVYTLGLNSNYFPLNFDYQVSFTRNFIIFVGEVQVLQV